MMKLIEKLGAFFVLGLTTHIRYFSFSWRILRAFINFKLFNPAIFLVFIRQTYFTGVQIFPTVFFISLLVGITLVGFLTKILVSLGAYDQIGQVVTITIIRELAPLVTGILLALRSSTAVGAEIAVMNLGNEMNTLKAYHINEYDYLFLPRIFAGLVSLFSLSTFFAFSAILGGYMLLSFQLNITFDYLIKLIIDYLTIYDIACFLYKTTFLGFFLMSIPIFTSIQIKGDTTMIPVALLKGMMRVFYAILFIEITGALI